MYSAGNTAINEANTFLSAARNYVGTGYLRPVLDLEWNGAGLSRSALSQWANDWMNHVQQQTGVEPMIYCNTNYAQNYVDSTLANRTLWIANWPANPEPQTGNPGIGIFNAWAFWQYAGDTSIGDITGIDLNVFNGTLAQLQNYVVGLEATIGRSPATLSATILAGQNAPDDGFVVTNTGDGALNYSTTVDAIWLSANPTAGTSIGEPDPITVTYSTASMRIGTYTATFQIADPNSTNSPQTVVVTLTVEPVPGDLNRDGSIDPADVSIFGGCMTGSGTAQTDPACQVADIDHDGDVDQSDFGLLQRCMSGTSYHPDPACAG